MATAATTRQDNCCQILMCGDGGAGKTALATSFIGGDLNHTKYNPTIHNEYYRTNFLNVGRVDIKDLQGQEEYTAIRLSAISDTDVFILVYDITKQSSLTELHKWIKEIKETKLKENEYKGIPFVVVGMKCDLEHNREVTENEGQQLAKELNDSPFFEACATPKLIINIQKVFESAITEWRKYQQYSVGKYENQIKKRKQRSKMENFMQGIALFTKNKNDENIDNDDNDDEKNENKVNDNKGTVAAKQNMFISAEMESIIDDMFQEQKEAQIKKDETVHDANNISVDLK